VPVHAYITFLNARRLPSFALFLCIMQSFTAIPPWPQSIILPAVLALGSTVLAWLLYQRWQEVEEERDRDPGLRQLFNLKWLPLISLSVAITSIVIAILIGVDSRDGDKAWFIIGACYLQIGFSACLLVGIIAIARLT
jgi:hypothetical protein